MCLHLHFQSHQQHPEPVEQRMLAVKTHIYICIYIHLQPCSEPSSKHALGLPSVVICKPSLPAQDLQFDALLLSMMQLPEHDMHHLGRLQCQIWLRSLHVHHCLAVPEQGAKSE